MAEFTPSCEPVATSYTMEALVPRGRVVTHVTVHQSLPAGTKLYTAAQLAAEVAAAVAKERKHYHSLVDWLKDQMLLNVEHCRIDKPETLGDWWVLRRPYMLGAHVSYGKTEDEAIAAAIRTDAEGQHG